LDAAELVVLLPQIGLEQLRGGEELEDRHVALGQALTGERERRVDQQPSRAESQCSGRSPSGEEGPAAGPMETSRDDSAVVRDQRTRPFPKTGVSLTESSSC
jgi:hypothetical protein